MADETNTSGQQSSDGSGQQVDWEARYKGLVKKVEELTLSNRDLSAQLALKSSEIEQSKTQLGIKDTEKTAAVTERDNQIRTLTEARLANEAALKTLQALEMKVKVAKKLGRMDLLEVADQIPNVGDEAALEAVFQSLSSFTDKAVKQEREKLLAGVTPPPSSTSTSITLPTTSESWEKYVNSFTIGTKDRAAAMNSWGSWVQNQRKK